MDVRLARPTDAPRVLALALNDDAQVVRSAWPSTNSIRRTVLHTLFPVALPGRLWIALDGSDVVLLEATPRRYVIGWDVTRLAVRGEGRAAFDSIVGAATEHMQSRGVPRLFARCRRECVDGLRQRGFHALASEYVVMGPEGEIGGETPLPVDSRYRMPQDAWPLHQMEASITPPLVRQLEGLTSLDWPNNRRKMPEIVVERDGKVVAWIAWGASGPRATRHLGMLVDPAHRELADDLLRHALRNAPVDKFTARIRDYQPEVLESFLNAGFHIVAEEVLMIKHAQVEAVRASIRRNAVRVPSIQAFHYQLEELAGPDHTLKTSAMGQRKTT